MVLIDTTRDGQHCAAQEAETGGFSRWPIVPAAEMRDKVAQYLLGTLYINGEGVAQNDELAIHWLRESAKQGYDRAIELLRDNDISLDPAEDT